MDHNPQLKPWATPVPNNVAGKGSIEVPGQTANLVWQNRAAAPTAFENAFGDALEEVFEAGAETAEQVADGLNRIGFRTPEGRAWTVPVLEATLARLGA